MSVIKALEATHRQRHEEERPVRKGRYQPGVRYEDGTQWPCHHRNSPENLHRIGLRHRGYYGDCARNKMSGLMLSSLSDR